MSDRRQLGIIDRSADTVVLTRAQAWYADWSIDILVYTIVLNLFDEYVDGVVIDSFTISLLTAILLKVMLVLLSKVEEPVSEYFLSKGTAAAKAVGVVVVFAILFGGKLLILEVVNLIFGDDVELGHIVEVLALIISMIAARRLMSWLFDRLGTDDGPAAAS
jgi:hypothetical protein